MLFCYNSSYVISLYSDKEIYEVFGCVLLSSVVDKSPSMLGLLDKSPCALTSPLKINGEGCTLSLEQNQLNRLETIGPCSG
jgi:hypothetical protein